MTTLNRLTIFFVFIYLCNFTASRADLIDDVCSRSLDPAYCNDTMRAGSGSGNQDYRKLADTGLLFAQTSTEQIINVLQTFQQNATDQGAKNDFYDCLLNYDIVKNQIINCWRALEDRNYGPLNERAQSSYDASTLCDSGFTERPEPEIVKTLALRIQTLLSTVSYIANKLQGN